MKKLSFSGEVERSLFKKFRKTIWARFILALKRYNLVEDGDKIAVCISGGKDSMLLAKLFQMLKKVSETNFEVVYLGMDPGYNAKNRQKLEENAKLLEIPLEIFESDIFETVETFSGSPCYMCARMRRGCLYNAAKERGCNKIALAHHFSDVIETTLMGMLYGAQIQAMPPKLRSKNFEGMELIRPLYCVHEDDIIAWTKYHKLSFLNCACKFTEKCEVDEDASARRKVKKLIKELKKDIPEVEDHIFKSIHNVEVDTLVGFKYNGKTVEFNDFYKKKKKKE